MKVRNAAAIAYKMNRTETPATFTTTITPITTIPPVVSTTVPHTSVVTAETSSITVDHDVIANTITEVAENTPCRTSIITSEFNYVLRDPKKGTACVLTNMTIHINLKDAKDYQVNEKFVKRNIAPHIYEEKFRKNTH